MDSKSVLENAAVLDLYAGTGALGLEALSRGANSAILVESNKQAAGVCIQNSRLIQDALASEGHEVSAKVQILSVQKYLNSFDAKFDLVFIDPPYELSNEAIAENLLALKSKLTENALVIVERSQREKVFNTEGYELLETKNFGDTAIYWLAPI